MAGLNDIDSWLTTDEFKGLYELARPLAIGVNWRGIPCHMIRMSFNGCRAEVSTILLRSPSKKKTSSPSSKELWAWTLTSDSIAPCSIRDVIQLEECTKDRMFCASIVYSISRLNAPSSRLRFLLARARSLSQC